MIYHQIAPHPDLTDYIDAFWIVKGTGNKLKKKSILPDGCVDLIFNLGDDCRSEKGVLTMRSKKSYLVGTMTTFKESFLSSSNMLMGIRFKPASFSSFYNYAPLNEITDKTIEFEQSLSPDIYKIEYYSVSYLNAFFLNTLSKKNDLSTVIKDIQTAKGQINIEILAKRNCTTVRQLERNFKKHVGISPKEFANIVRFQFALSKIKNNENRENLSNIAFECGYYDHAHLSNEIKRYTGATPSRF